ncbi:cytochrome P450 [Fimicolochytrium jonesii]|uniref:cytochrome P450 n=1 Tax=Fimicolochytrium jonesii TaxID=1396493 RepID=UPI0022FF3EA4|nr:cytochrome P450 [Fimicolochytrium jonesii]KAI8822225.1 cytochrome P450 [Fimicolochytrium jonesii]
MSTATHLINTLVEELAQKATSLSTHDLLLVSAATLIATAVTVVVRTGGDRKATQWTAEDGTVLSRPPARNGWIPWLGVALQYGKNPDAFQRKCSETFGDIFSLRIGGKRFILITDPFTIPNVYKMTKTLSFSPLADQVTVNAFGATKASPNKNVNAAMHTQYARYLSGESLRSMSESFASHLSTVLWDECKDRSSQELSDGWEIDLYSFTRWVIYAASAKATYGDTFDTKSTYDDFVTFDKHFPILAAGAPSILVPEGRAARKRLIAYLATLRNSTMQNQAPIATARDEVFDRFEFGDNDRGAWTLAFLWATQGNSTPTVFWYYAYALTHGNLFSALTSEVNQAITPTTTPSSNPFSVAVDIPTLASLPRFNATFSETLRMASSTFSIRVALEDVRIKHGSNGHEYLVKKGEWIVISTRFIHTDAGIFERSADFVDDRFLDVVEEVEAGVNAESNTPTTPATTATPTRTDSAKDIARTATTTAKPTIKKPTAKKFSKDGKPVRHHLLPFGGGASLCPGRHFASFEIKLFAAMMMYFFDVEIVGGKNSKDEKSEKNGKEGDDVGDVDEGVSLPEMDMTRAGFGVLPPVDDLRVRIKLKGHVVERMAA